MKVRMVALAGVSLLAFTLAAAAGESGGATSGGATSSGTSAPPMQPPPPPPPPPPPAPAPAMAWMTQGWYVGAGAGWSRMANIQEDSAFPGNASIPTQSSALVTGSIGYRFADRLRLEGEIGWDQHNIKDTVLAGENFSGHLTTWSFLLNAAYDFPLSSNWDYTLGAGAGIGNGDVKVSGNFGDSSSGSNQGFMWQAFTGFGYWVCPTASLNLDYRYRSLSENESYTFDGVFPYRIKALHEQALMLSVRYYPFAAH
jgi:opacity protein-like surface antigen